MTRDNALLYQVYESRRRMLAPMFAMAALQASALRTVPEPWSALPQVRSSRAFLEILCALELTHRHPGFEIGHVQTERGAVAIEEQRVLTTPFGTLVRFAKSGGDPGPPVLVVPGLAGHFGSLVRATVRTVLAHHDVYVADWHNARDVPTQHGRFGFDEYVEHLIEFLAAIGPGAHLMAVCQPCPAALAAAAIMAADDHPAQPQGLILMAGPVDARISPGRVNRQAGGTSFERVAKRVITVVPRPHPGAGRRVYPGFVQAMGFLGLAPRRHVDSFGEAFRHLLNGEEEAAAKTIAFYDEYFAVLDVTEEFYLETAQRVFRDHDLARGRLTWKGRPVEPSRITSALLTIEGGKDELCPPGQTRAAHALCSSIPVQRKAHHLQADVGHYGVFSGQRFEREIYPRIRRFTAANASYAP